jgi:hypothetical protein
MARMTFTSTLESGPRVRVRPIQPTDREALRHDSPGVVAVDLDLARTVREQGDIEVACAGR